MPSEQLARVYSTVHDELEEAAVSASMRLEAFGEPSSVLMRMILTRPLYAVALGVLWSFLLVGTVPVDYQWLYFVALLMMSTAIMATLVLHETEPNRAREGVPPSQPFSQPLSTPATARSTSLSQVLSDEDIALVQLLRPGPFVPKATHSASAVSRQRLGYQANSTCGSVGTLSIQPVVNPNARLRNSTGSHVAVQAMQPATTTTTTTPTTTTSTSLLAALAAGFQAGFNVGYCSGVVAGIISGTWQQCFTGPPAAEPHAQGLAGTSLPGRQKSASRETGAVSANNKTQSPSLVQHSQVHSGVSLPAQRSQAKATQQHWL